MQRLITCLALAMLLNGCGVAALLFSEEARQALADNFEESIEAQQALSEHVFALSRGDIDISDYNYTPPTATEDGVLQITDGFFPFGTGSLTVYFTVEGDAGPVNPYDVDLSTHSSVSVTATFTFTGLSKTGVTMSAAGDFSADTVVNGPNEVTTDVSGNFSVTHAGYDVDLATNNLIMVFDLLAEECTSVTGRVNGTIDIPDFFYDADFVVDGYGDRLQIGIDAVVGTLDYFIDLTDL